MLSTSSPEAAQVVGARAETSLLSQGSDGTGHRRVCDVDESAGDLGGGEGRSVFVVDLRGESFELLSHDVVVQWHVLGGAEDWWLSAGHPSEWIEATHSWETSRYGDDRGTGSRR
jgi:hypothetical protein